MQMKPIILVIVLLIPNLLAAQWVHVDGPWIGPSVQCLATDGSSFYAGGRDGKGLFISTDKGDTWTNRNNGLPQNTINAIILSSVEGSDYIFAGTEGRGIYRSTDGGADWLLVSTGNSLEFSYSRYMTKCGKYIFTIHLGNIYKSNEYGDNWKIVSSTLGYATSLFVHDSTIIAEFGSGIYASTDFGYSWSHINVGISFLTSFTNSDSLHLFGSNGSGIALSKDNGVTWQAINTGLPMVSPDFTSYQEITSLTISGSNYFASVNGTIYRSADQGAHWIELYENKLEGLEVYILKSITDSVGLKYIIAGTNHGFYRSSDNGDNWSEQCMNFYVIKSTSLAYLNGYLFAGGDKGLFRTTNNGLSWSNMMNIPILSLIIKDSTVITGTMNKGVFISFDRGETWANINRGLPSYKRDNVQGIIPITTLAVSGEDIYAGTDSAGIYKSTNQGGNWSISYNSFTNTSVTALIAYNSNVYAGTADRKFLMSTNAGLTWMSQDYAFDNTYVSSFACYDTFLFVITQSGSYYPGRLYRITNHESGYGIGYGLDNYYLNAIAVSKTDSIVNLIVGAEWSGVYLSTDNGDNWAHIDSGLSAKRIYTFTISDTNNFASTNGGIYKFSIPKVNDISYLTLESPQNGNKHVPLKNSVEYPRSVDLVWGYRNGTFITFNVRLQLSTDSSFSIKNTLDTVLTTTDLHAFQSIHACCLEPRTTYFWRMGLVYPNLITKIIGWSNTQNFKTAGCEINGVVFEDLDLDGIRNEEDPGIIRWKMLLSGKGTGDVRTDSAGRYTFAGLDSGSYTVTVSSEGIWPILSKWKLTYPDTNLYSLSVGFDSARQGVNFGWNFPWNSIGGKVFEDVNENGRFDSLTEQTFSGWPLVLSGYESNQGTTNENGVYCFRRLWDNYYQVKLGTIPPGWESVPSGSGVVQEYYFGYYGYGNHPDSADFAVHRIPSRVKNRLTVTENLDSTESMNIRFGVRTGATYGIWRADSACTNTDYAEGEFELPPPSGGPLDARFVDPTIPSTGRFGLGSYTDMRPYYSTTQADTYKFRFVPAVGYPVTIRWSSSAIESSYTDMVVLKDPFMAETNMKLTDSLVVIDPDITWLRLIASGPKMSVVGAVDNPNVVLPIRYQLAQNYPNPFNPTTYFQFSIVNCQLTVLKVYDVLGREVTTLVNEVKQPGNYAVSWDASAMPSGIYFYRLTAGNFIETKKLILMK
jgi:photosystem II stability/assembly factor-like uncharacterized protein